MDNLGNTLNAMWKDMVRLVLTMFFVVIVLSQPVLGQGYPTKPIEIAVGYSAGSTFDLVARVIADLTPKYLHQPVIVNNKVGAGGSLAAADIISSAPDGYKLALLTNTFFATTIKTQKVPFEQNDLTPVANFSEEKLCMVVKGDSPWRTFNDLLDYAKKNPGKLRWSHLGRGLTTHLNALLMFRKAGAETTDIPYRGSPEQLTALLGGHLDASSIALGIFGDHIRAGKVRVLVFYSDRRYGDFPNVPCSVELGFPQAKLKTYVGFYAHKNVPENVKKTLLDAFKKVSEEPEFRKRIQELGEDPRFGDPEFLKQTIKKDEEVGVPILKELGIYVGK